MQQYLDALTHVMERGIDKENRTGIDTRSVFGYQMRFDLTEGFPLLTTKKVYLHAIIHELIWFLKGDTNIKYLKDNGVRIWDEWADENGDLGPVYGKQWRNWEGVHHVSGIGHGHEWESGGCKPVRVDQLADVIKQIKSNPDSRRLIVSAWNPSEVDQMALPPCHMFFQFYVAEGKLSCHLYQRSADLFLGVPFNIASYALLTMMVAHVCDLEMGEFVHTFGDMHIYHNHFDKVELQLSREPRPLPTMALNPGVRSIDDFVFEDFTLSGYNPHPGIKATVAV